VSHVSPTLFAVLVWGSLAAVAAVFAYLLYAVLEAERLQLVEDHGP